MRSLPVGFAADYILPPVTVKTASAAPPPPLPSASRLSPLQFSFPRSDLIRAPSPGWLLSSMANGILENIYRGVSSSGRDVMGFFSGRVTCTRFRVLGHSPGMFGPQHLAKLE